MNIRNYSILIRASDLHAGSLCIDRPDHGWHWPFSGDCSPAPQQQQQQHSRLKSRARAIICPAGRGRRPDDLNEETGCGVDSCDSDSPSHFSDLSETEVRSKNVTPCNFLIKLMQITLKSRWKCCTFLELKWKKVEVYNNSKSAIWKFCLLVVIYFAV